MSSSEAAGPLPELLLAKWSDRFLAWLVDFVIVSAVVWSLLAAASVPFWFNGPPGSPDNALVAGRWALSSLAFFAYWTYFESTSGQSIGKKLLKIKATDLRGGRLDAKNAAIESFGKAFLLPLDVLLGWLFTNDKRQRLLARAGDSVVIKLKADGDVGDVRYTKE